MKTDVLVVGSGIAGLSFAIKIAEAMPEIRVTVLNKNSNDHCNTAYAQGGIAVVLDRVRDSFEQHVEDTIKAGRGLNDKKVVEMVVSQAPERLMELISWGTCFDQGAQGKLALGLEGGHSQRRIVHHRDLTGLELERKLILKAGTLENLEFIEKYFVIDLLLEEKGSKTCVGVKVLDQNSRNHIRISSRVTFLATGGCGMIFQNTTNPSVATADGVAMAERAGAKVSNMNFIQFHPTALFEEGKHSLFLISEAVRGFGAYIINHHGHRFLFKSDSRGELATRDIVSDAIVRELKISGERTVFLDCRHLNFHAFQKEFPTIVTYCQSKGLNLRKDLVPIVPAAHFQCGGIEVDQQARTTIRNLYASGECAHTGLHGANRLASNSLLEALVFSHQAYQVVKKELEEIPVPCQQAQAEFLYREQEVNNEIIESLGQRLKEIMNYDIVHVSGKREQKEALEFLKKSKIIVDGCRPFNTGTIAFYELRNMIDTSILILDHAIKNDSKWRKKYPQPVL